jgi:MFS transporter, DHA1 family, tetracycline resistance protein
MQSAPQTEVSSVNTSVQKSALTLVFLTIFIDMLGIGILQPVSPFLVGKFRPDAASLGWVIAIYSIAQFMAAPGLGVLSDRIGRRPVLLLSLVGNSFGYLLFALAGNYPMMLVARVVEGITGGAVTVAQAYIADVTQPKDRARSFGLIGMALGLGFVFGPGLGGALSKIDIHAPVYASAIMALLNAIFAFFLMPESLQQKQTGPVTISDFNPIVRVARIFADPRVNKMAWAFFIFNFGFAAFTSIFAKYAKERFSMDPDQVGYILLVVGLTILAVQGLMRKLVPMFGEWRLAWGGLLIAAVVFQFIPFVADKNLLYFSQSALAFGVALCSSNIRALISNSVSQMEQGTILGGTQGLMSVALITGPLLASYLFDHVGQTSPYHIAGILLLIAMLFVIAARPQLAVAN